MTDRHSAVRVIDRYTWTEGGIRTQADGRFFLPSLAYYIILHWESQRFGCMLSFDLGTSCVQFQHITFACMESGETRLLSLVRAAAVAAV